MSQYFIVWNANRTEGFITDDACDARMVASKTQMRGGSSLGMEFQSLYEDNKRTVQAIEIHPELSARAIKLLRRIKDGEWYKAYANDTPKAMQELIDHGLVGIAGRVESVSAAYVAIGHTPLIMDRAPGER